MDRSQRLRPQRSTSPRGRHTGDIRTRCAECGEFHWRGLVPVEPDPHFDRADDPSWEEICADQDAEEELLDAAGDDALEGNESWKDVAIRQVPAVEGTAHREAVWAAHNLPHPWWWHEACGREVMGLGLSPLFPGDGTAIPLATTEWLEELQRHAALHYRAYPTPWLQRFSGQLAAELNRRQRGAA